MSDIVLETIGLTKSFRRRRAVDDLNLRVFKGDIYGYLGPNGAGKSTTIRMLTGLVRPNHGTARLMGFDTRTQRVRALQEVGALVESPCFHKYLSARGNLKLFSRLSGGCEDRRIDQVLDTVGLLDRANDKVKTFSHGMLQRLGIAQALLPDPTLVILDEPTSGLDPQGMKDVRELILRLAREGGVTVFLSSHLLHEVEQTCTRVGIISRGKLIAEGDVDQLLRRDVELVEFRVSDERRAAEALESLKWVEVLTSPPTSNLTPDPAPSPKRLWRVGDSPRRRGETEEGGMSSMPRGTIGDQGIGLAAACVLVRAPAERVPEINRALVTAGVDVFAMMPKTLTLEELFLSLVGEGGNDG